jgi:N6-adenosine-specific RNA methylase IME4
MNDAADANQAYGALTAEFYIAGFTFERAMAGVLRLLKTGGWKKVGDGFDDVKAFVRSLHLDQLRVVTEQRQEFVQRVKELQPEVSNRAIAGALGVHHDTIDRAARGGNPPAERRDAKQGRKAAGGNPPPGAADGRRDARIIVQRDEREERREDKLKSIAAAAVLSGRYSVIYADAPWEDEFGPNPRQTELHYPVMMLDEIKALPVNEISTPDAALYLWALPHMVPTALEVMAAWGFEYRTQMIWGKDKIGIGQWCRNQHEPLLIGRRGSFPPPPESVRSSSLVMAPRSEHSSKPAVFAELIERWYPDVPKIELFRRGAPRPGWAAWGNEVKAEAS